MKQKKILSKIEDLKNHFQEVLTTISKGASKLAKPNDKREA